MSLINYWGSGAPTNATDRPPTDRLGQAPTNPSPKHYFQAGSNDSLPSFWWGANEPSLIFVWVDDGRGITSGWRGIGSSITSR